MQAVAIERYGGPEVMAVIERPEPESAAGEVVVRVEAAGVGLWDAKERRGEAGRDHKFPLVLGWEAVGVVDRVGPGVVEYEPGDCVMSYAYRRGAYAELVATPASQTGPRP